MINCTEETIFLNLEMTNCTDETVSPNLEMTKCNLKSGF